ncbi:MAG TPA: DUF6516 family protein [Thermoanaerobaculia bacterium]|nr:DUF6516 family protein [Thermoanaerobaculia bacterium]
MTDALRTVEDYELFLYTLTEQFSSLLRSTVTLIRRAAPSRGWRASYISIAVSGSSSASDWSSTVFRSSSPATPTKLGRQDEKLYWYDPQPHPNEPALQSTHPHHKHVPPEMKHNRVPAPGMSFTRPNLPMLIGEIERLLEERQSQPLGSE